MSALRLQEPLALASGALPDWCEQLTSKCPFLIPFETRQLYFTCTAFGASRSDPRVYTRLLDEFKLHISVCKTKLLMPVPLRLGS